MAQFINIGGIDQGTSTEDLPRVTEMELEEYPAIRPAIKGKTFRIPDVPKERNRNNVKSRESKKKGDGRLRVIENVQIRPPRKSPDSELEQDTSEW